MDRRLLTVSSSHPRNPTNRPVLISFSPLSTSTKGGLNIVTSIFSLPKPYDEPVYEGPGDPTKLIETNEKEI